MDERSLSIELPRGWSWARLGQFAEINPRFAPEDLSDDLEVSFLPMRCVEQLTGRIDLSITRKLLEVRKGYTSFEEGDILFAKITPCMENGKVAIARGLQSGIGFGSTEFHVIRLPKSLPRGFFFLFLIQAGLRRDARMGMTGSAGQLRVPTAYMREIEIPLPPLAEQRRIVAKIEELFSQLDAGVAALDQAKAQLKRYRQAVLKHAFEGKLTQAWREAHKDELEPASALLERIKMEREKAATGKRRRKPLPPLDTSELPEGWVWARLEIVCEKVQDGSHFSPTDQFPSPGPDRFLYVTAKNIKEHGIDLSNITYVDGPFHRSIYRRCNPEYGDVLLIKDGVKTGVATVNSLSEQFSLLSSVALIKPKRGLVYPRLLKHFLNSPQGFIMITGQMTGTAIKRIILARIRESYMPLPAIMEQQQIVAEVERRLSVADAVEQMILSSESEARRLRQSILKRAFQGKLVPQDPSDEPAQVLLERIKAEKARREA
ncbi:MAG: restriction endonuclease subunit S [Chloroflexota bacterium]